ncbi:MAG: cytochrome c [Fimbriimonadaceae bacterium]
MRSFLPTALGLAGLAVLSAGCHTDMWRQAKVLPQTRNDFFFDKMSDRMPVDGTVPVGRRRADEAFYTGRGPDGRLLTELPESIVIDGVRVDTKTELLTVLNRGKERFNAICSHCHGKVGDGKGMITQRGLALRRAPATFHSDRLRNMPIGHFYDVQTNGMGIMYAQASRVTPDDRWAIAAYIRALQLSQSATPGDLDPNLPITAENNPSMGARAAR